MHARNTPKRPRLITISLAAVVAHFNFGFAVSAFGGQLGRKIADEIAIRIARAAQEKSVAADALEQLALAALLALLPGGNAGLVGLHLALGLFEVLREAAVKFLHGFRQGILPSSISSSSSSMRAVKPTSKISSKLLTSSTLTFSPSMVGENRP